MLLALSAAAFSLSSIPFTYPITLLKIAALFGTQRAVLFMTEGLKKDLEPEQEGAIANVMLRLSDPDIVPSNLFVRITNRIFGEKLLSLQSFIVSALFTVTSMALIYLFWSPPDFKVSDAELVSYAIPLILLLNIITDWVSVGITRFILQQQHVGTTKKLLLDLAANFLVVIFVPAMVAAPIFYLFIPQDFDPDIFFMGFGYIGYTFGAIFIEMNDENFIFFVVCISTFTTSIWLWLHLAAFGGRYLAVVNRALVPEKKVRKNPMRALGLLVGYYILFMGSFLIVLGWY